jgi:arylsulfatase A-like enzyme
MHAIVQNRGFDILEDAGAIGGNVESSFGVDEPAAVARLFSFIDSVPREQRFFAMYLPTAGHHPYATPAPGPYKDDGGIGSYRNALRYGDESLGALFDGLRQRGLDRNTLLIVFGDHGEAFGQHDGNYAHTMFLYNENVRVPYAIVAPGLLPDVRVSRPISLIDTAPTILDLLGLAIPDEYQGASLLDSRPRMALFFTDYSLGWLGLVDGCWKALHETGSKRTKLFDICQDPSETNDLSAANDPRAEFYRERLEQWIGAQGER